MERLRPVAALCFLAVAALPASAHQQASGSEPSELAVEPGELNLEVGESAELSATVRDAGGNVLDAPVIYFSTRRQYVGVTPEGKVEAYRPGSFMIIARVPRDPARDSRRDEAILETSIRVNIAKPPIDELVFVDAPSTYYAGTAVRPELVLTDRSGATRFDVAVRFESTDPAVVEPTPTGLLKLKQPGTARLVGRAENSSATLSITVSENPTATVVMRPTATEARAGDVIHVNAMALDASGNEITTMPIETSFRARTVEHGRGEPPSGLITEDGRFVADLPGEYVLVAVAGDKVAMETVQISPRNVRREIEFVGQARVNDRYTSDLWVWEAPDGRDYAITGTWNAEGHAYIWDVTDPTDMVKVDEVQVDARTVNDVKVSEDGSIAVISREGASSRRNGIVILDVANPREGVEILSSFDEQLTGGVHNVFVYDSHVYALSAGTRYDIINIEDPRNPYRVGRFELDTPGHRIHDVWVADGIAYSSNWIDGVVAVDVGGGGKGGSPRNPLLLGKYSYPSGWNHAAFPYYSESAGKMYVFAGDEAVDRIINTADYDDEPERYAGWIHVIEWDAWNSPKEVARYEVPEAGTHNLWIEDDIMYVAYYQGGLRVVDVSGELLGDLYRQGREIGRFLPFDPEGWVPNAAFTWGPQPFKGNIFFSDHYSGLWAVRLKPGDED